MFYVVKLFWLMLCMWICGRTVSWLQPRWPSARHSFPVTTLVLKMSWEIAQTLVGCFLARLTSHGSFLLGGISGNDRVALSAPQCFPAGVASCQRSKVRGSATHSCPHRIRSSSEIRTDLSVPVWNSYVCIIADRQLCDLHSFTSLQKWFAVCHHSNIVNMVTLQRICIFLATFFSEYLWDDLFSLSLFSESKKHQYM